MCVCMHIVVWLLSVEEEKGARNSSILDSSGSPSFPIRSFLDDDVSASHRLTVQIIAAQCCAIVGFSQSDDFFSHLPFYLK